MHLGGSGSGGGGGGGGDVGGGSAIVGAGVAVAGRAAGRVVRLLRGLGKTLQQRGGQHHGRTALVLLPRVAVILWDVEEC